MIGQGKGTRTIAEDLNVLVKTIDAHRAQANTRRMGPMPLPPRTASELARIRAQIRAGRLEWQDSTEPEAHIPVENYFSDDDARRRGRAPVPAACR